MTFEGFGPDLVDFYAGLELDNSTGYWERHREVFRDQVQQPMLALTADLGDRFGEFRIFRPHRDVRFSHDKSPYKTAHAAVAETPGGVSLYVHVSADRVLAAAGIYLLERDQLLRWRDAVAEPGTGGSLLRALRAAEQAGLSIDSGMQPPLKTAPRGFPRDHPRITWLQWRGCIAHQMFDPEDARQPDLVSSVADAWTAAAPLTRWLERHVGPSVPDDA